MPEPLHTILLSGYFGPAGRDPKLDYFARLDTALRAHGYRLHVLNMNGHRMPRGLEGESYPFLVEKSHKLPIDRVVSADSIRPELRQAAEIDAECWHRSPAREAVRLSLFQEHFRNVVNRVQPRLCIAWHQFFSFHFALPGLLAELGIPLLYAEFGPLPGTIMFDRGGQMAESDIATRSEEFLHIPVTDAELEAAALFLVRVRAERRTRKPQAPPGAVREALRARNVDASTPIIFYAGQYDCRTGMRPRSLPNARLHSPWFDGTLDALGYIAGLAKKNGWMILFKPHPLAATPQAALAAIPDHDRIIAVPEASIFECIDIANAVTTIVSQVSYMALIHGKPCVMLGRNQINEKGCVYEPTESRAIEESLRAAICEGFTRDQHVAFLRHVAQLLNAAVFVFDNDLQVAGPRDIESTCDFLLSCAEAPPGVPCENRPPAHSLYGALRTLSFIVAPFRP